MEINGTFKSWKSLFLDKDRIYELNAILLEFFEKVRFEAVTITNKNIKFDDIDELICYDNFGDYRVKDINIYCYVKSDNIRLTQIKIKSTSGYYGIFYSIFECIYTLDSIENCSIFESKLKNFIKKSKTSLIIYRKIFILLTTILFFLSTFYIFDEMNKHEKDENSLYFLLALMINVSPIILCSFLDKYFNCKALPSVVFYLGEEIKRYDKKVSLRNNIFWGVFIAVLASIAGAFIYAKLHLGN